MSNEIADTFSELMKDTQFVLADTGSLMTARGKVRTPLYVLNCILGGGVPLSVISEASGPPSSGKSTFFYQTAGLFQKQYPKGVVMILDIEASMDNSRLKTLGVDTSRVLRLPSTTMESAFKNLFVVLEKVAKKIECGESDINELFVVYDTISTGGTEKQHTAAIEGKGVMNAGGMQEAARVLKQNIANLFPYIERIPIHLGLLNQVFTQFGTWTSSVSSGGGFGLKHGAHIHFNFSKGNEVLEDGFLVENKGSMKLEKSKLSPKILDIPCNIDITKGGIIDEVGSFVEYISHTNIGIIKTGSWYSIKDTIDYAVENYGIDRSCLVKYDRNIRRNDLYDAIRDDKDLLNLLQVRLIDFINSKYTAQREVNGDYREELIKDCSYFQNSKLEKDESDVVQDVED